MSLSQAKRLNSWRERSVDFGKEFIRILGDSFFVHSIFFIFIFFYALVSAVSIFLFPDMVFFNFWEKFNIFITNAIPNLAGSALLALVIFRGYHIATVVKPRHPLVELFRTIKSDVLDPNRYIIGLPMFIVIFSFMCIFGQVKQNIPNVIPFSWDEYLMQLDHWLHFGNHPWRLLQPIIGYPIITYVISKCYSIWMVIMWVVWMWLAFDNRMSHLRMRFFVAFVLVWMIGGSVLAVLLSSAGPVFYGSQGLSPDPYAGLLSYLQEADRSFSLSALLIQDLLWSAYKGQISLNAGISAMPSMHNATSLLFVLAVWPVNRKLGIALSVFAAVIFVGSIHLGWHYAVDAYLAYAVTLVCWWIAGRVATWYVNLPAYRRFEQTLESARIG